MIICFFSYRTLLSLTCSLFFFNETATTEIYTYEHTLSLHDALPIYCPRATRSSACCARPWPPIRSSPRGSISVPTRARYTPARTRAIAGTASPSIRSEEHTSELQSLMRNSYAVFCLKKKNKKSHTYNLIKYVTLTTNDINVYR